MVPSTSLLILYVFCASHWATAFVSGKNKSPIRARHSDVSMGVRSTIKGAWTKIRGGSSARSDEELKKGIAKFYDESSGIWLDVWVRCNATFIRNYTRFHDLRHLILTTILQ
jgi:hypothetical protein